MACHGNLMEYSLEPKPAPGIPREKIFDDSPIVLEVCPRARWSLLPRPPHHSPSAELQPPLPVSNPLLLAQERAAMTATPSSPPTTPLHLLPAAATNPTMAAIVGGGSAGKAGHRGATMSQGAIIPRPQGNNSHCHAHSDERWLSQVEIITHAGPHRRLWMGPQFVFKTYGNCSISGPTFGMEAPDLDAAHIPNTPVARHTRSDPVGMPGSNRGGGPLVPVVIESGSGSSFEQSPRLLEGYSCSSDGEVPGNRIHSGGEWRIGANHGAIGESRLREDLADAMMEGPGLPVRDTGRRWLLEEERVSGDVIAVPMTTAREEVVPQMPLPGEAMVSMEETKKTLRGGEVEGERKGDEGGVAIGQGLVQCAAAEGANGDEGEKVVLDEGLDEDSSQQVAPRRGRRAKKKKR